MLVISGREQGYCCCEMLRRVVIVLCRSLCVPNCVRTVVRIVVYCMSCALHFSVKLTSHECLDEMVTQPALPWHVQPCVLLHYF